MREPKRHVELLQGTLDVLVLRTPAPRNPRTAHAIAKAIQCNSGEVLRVEEGSLYPALHRLIKTRPGSQSGTAHPKTTGGPSSTR